MSTFDNLPLLLISAANETLATDLISDLIDNEVSHEYETTNTQYSDRVWRLVNKYYSADIRIHKLLDNAEIDFDPKTVEAHIIYISEDEVNDIVTRAERRAADSAGAWRGAHVRVLVTAGAAPGGRAWAAAQRAEHVQRGDTHCAPSPAPAPAPAGPFAELRGVAQARAALHAHVWSNLVRTDVARPLALHDESCESSSVESEGEEHEEEDEEVGVEQAEAFVAALGALGEARELRERGAARGEGEGDRLAHAELLVAAFCRALGYEPDIL